MGRGDYRIPMGHGDYGIPMGHGASQSSSEVSLLTLDVYTNFNNKRKSRKKIL